MPQYGYGTLSHGRGPEPKGKLAQEGANVCVIPFIKRAERGRHTPHNYESTPVDPLRHVGIVSSTEAPKLNN